MAWSTTVISPPDGDMAAYFASLRRLLTRGGDRCYLPGHGPPLPDPSDYVGALLAHRLAREQAILATLAAAPASSPTLVEALYPALDPGLRRAAEQSVLAHLLKLHSEAKVRRGEGDEAAAVWQSAE